MRRRNKINWTALGVIIAGIALFVTIIVNLPQIKSNIPSFQKEDFPFEVNVSISYFNEGESDYNDKIPFTIIVNAKEGRNITYLELKKENFIVSRKDEGLNKPVASILWKYSYSSSLILVGNINPLYNSYISFPQKAEGEFWGCKNCFSDKDYPYKITYIIDYKESGEELKHITLEREIPIR